MPISTDMMVRVAHADIEMFPGFSSSVRHWHPTDEDETTWRTYAESCDPLLIGERSGVTIDGNCSSEVSAPEGGVVHVYGDLNSSCDGAGFYELVVTGNVARGVQIKASGHCSVFVGGNFAGELCSTGPEKIWIEGDFSGTIKTGGPLTRISIGGDYTGQILPTESASLLHLSVAGFAAQSSLEKIVDFRYTQFNASIGESDVVPGLYPPNGHLRGASGGNSFNSWCVFAERQA